MLIFKLFALLHQIHVCVAVMSSSYFIVFCSKDQINLDADQDHRSALVKNESGSGSNSNPDPGHIIYLRITDFNLTEFFLKLFFLYFHLFLLTTT